MKRQLAALKGDDDDARWKAAIALGRAGKPAAPALIKALHHPDYRVRMAAANAIRDMGSRGAAAVPALAENLGYSEDRELGYPPKPASSYRGSPSMEVRWCAVAALGHIGPRALPAVPALIALLRGEHEGELAAPTADDARGLKHWRAFELRGAGAWVLQRLGAAAAKRYPEVIPALAAGLQDPARMVRINAAAALRRMGPAAQPAVPSMLKALKHEDQYTRVAAALAFTALGNNAALYLPRLIECHNSIRLDSLSRKRLRRAMFGISGAWPKVEPSPAPPAAKRRWAALDRRDFLLVVQPFADCSVLIDPDKLVAAFVKARMGNAMTYWADHTWYNTPPPTADQLKQWGMAMVWYFFTEDIFNPKLQRDWGYATLDEYNAAFVEQILETGRVLGKSRCLWSVGHEHMDAVEQWAWQPDGSRKLPVFRTKRAGYEFYRKWIRSSIHKRHWLEYGSTRSFKFFDGWNTDAKATWEFLADRDIGASPVTMMSGGVSPVLAHASFDILPQIGMYWWECQVEGTSLQVGSAYVRGACRQYGKQWLLDASPWSLVLGGPGRGYLNGKWSGGVTDETQLRTWLYGYLAGADVVLEESSGGTHFRPQPPPGPSDRPVITSTGKTAQQAAKFCFELCPERGEPYNPVAVLLEHKHGFDPRPHTNFRRDGAWGYMPMGAGEYEIEKFWCAAFPGHSSFPRQGTVPGSDCRCLTVPAAGVQSLCPCAIEPLTLTESALGDCFDVLTDTCSQAVLQRYPRVMTLGGIVVGRPLWRKLLAYVKAGGELAINVAHLEEALLADPVFGCRFGKWIESQGIGDGVRFSLRALEPRGARVVLADVAGRPVITERAAGRGKLYLIAARRGLSGGALGARSLTARSIAPSEPAPSLSRGEGAPHQDDKCQWLPLMTAFLRQWIEPVWPVKVTTAKGPAPQVMLNKLKSGWLVSIGNHGGQEWAGAISLRGLSRLGGAGFQPADEHRMQSCATWPRRGGSRTAPTPSGEVAPPRVTELLGRNRTVRVQQQPGVLTWKGRAPAYRFRVYKVSPR